MSSAQIMQLVRSRSRSSNFALLCLVLPMIHMSAGSLIACAQTPIWQKKMEEYQRRHDAYDFPGQEKKERAALNEALGKGVKGKDLADCYQNLAEAIFNQYRFPDALPNYQAALDIREKIAPESVDMARSLYGVGYCKMRTRPEIAKGLLEHCLQIMEKNFPPQSIEIQKPLSALMVIDFGQHDYRSARQIQERIASMTSKRPEASVDEVYADKVQTSIFRKLDGDAGGAREAALEAKKIRDSAPPGYFAPDNLDKHLSWADVRLFKPQKFSYAPAAQPPSHAIPTVSVHRTPPNLAPTAPGSSPSTNPADISHATSAGSPHETAPSSPAIANSPTSVSDHDNPATNSLPPVNSYPDHSTDIAMLPPEAQAGGRRYTYYIDNKKVSYDVYRSRILYNSAGDLIKNKSYREAKEALEKVLAIDPSFASAYCALGTVLAHLDLKEQALQMLQHALELKPQSDSAWIAIAGLYEEVGKLNEALDAYRQFLRRFPNDPHCAMILSTTRLAELELRSRSSKSKCPAVPGADGEHDYLLSAAHEGLARWNQSEFPLAIYIKPLPQSAVRFDAMQLLRKSLIEWSNRTDGVVSFKEVSSESSAKIIVGWVTTSGELNEDAEAGEARVEQIGGTIKKANVAIDLRNSEKQDFQSALHTTVLHEIGHCLGLIGHSPRAGDVMYFTELMSGPTAGLTARDVRTLQLIYSAPNVSSQPSMSSRSL